MNTVGNSPETSPIIPRRPELLLMLRVAGGAAIVHVFFVHYFFPSAAPKAFITDAKTAAFDTKIRRVSPSNNVSGIITSLLFLTPSSTIYAQCLPGRKHGDR